MPVGGSRRSSDETMIRWPPQPPRWPPSCRRPRGSGPPPRDDAMFYAGELSRATADRYLDPATLCGQSPGTRRPRIGPLRVEPPPVIVDSGRGDRHNPPPSPGHHRRSAVHDGPLARQAGRLESVPRKGRTASVKQTHAPLRATRAGSSDDPASRGRTTLPNEREDGIDIDGFDQVVLESRL